ncbi:YbdD/YjiX family protein [Nocardia sp. IBHARD005]|uniref:YbdD/YjiX family protein n=1 Tax=Nocardia sp. IBHARD005 TaxID=3457765 RepID=UPI004058C9C2
MGCAHRRGQGERARIGARLLNVSVVRDADGRFSGSAVRTPVAVVGTAGPARAMLRRVWAAARGVARWYSAINGGLDYERYVDHLRRNHPGAPVPSVRDYWRERYAEAERNPANRCC